jgi:hypothetical protein
MRFNTLSITSSLFLIICFLASFIHAQDSSFQSYSKNFSSQILGSGATVTILKQVKLPLFHEAAVYFPPTKSLFITSDYINDPSINSNKSTVLISRVSGLDHPANVTVETINIPTIPFPNSGYRYITSRNGKAAADNYLVYLGQGNSLNDPPGGVFFLNALPPYNATNLIATYGKFPSTRPTMSPSPRMGAYGSRIRCTALNTGIGPHQSYRTRFTASNPRMAASEQSLTVSVAPTGSLSLPIRRLST